MEQPSLLALSDTFFLKVARLPQEPKIAPAPLAAELLGTLADFAEAALAAGHSSQLVESAKYALCAWADEWIYTRTALAAEWFGHALAVQAFADPAAGSNFFARLAELHRLSHSEGALEIYGRALLRGFHGKYRMENTCQASLKTHISQILSKAPRLQRAQPTTFSAPARRTARSPWPKRLFWLSLLSCPLALGFCAWRAWQAGLLPSVPFLP
jgi:type IV/VI secretion system ImpK/VasF family protein